MINETGAHTVNHGKKSIAKILTCWELYLFLVPAIAIIFIFNYIPMYGVIIAFKNYKPATLGILGSEWVGLQHFERLFKLPMFLTIIKNTLVLSTMSIVMGFPVPVLFALYLNQIKNISGKRFLQTVSYLPHFISTVVMVGMILTFLSPRAGLYGIFTRAIGIEPQNIMGKANLFPLIYVLSGIWQSFGWGSIIYLASLSSIDPALYEASVIDGANKAQKTIYIDIPHLLPTMVIMLILSCGTVLSVGFEKVYLMQNATNISVSEIISTYVFKVGIQKSQFSLATAMGLFNSFVNLLMLSLVNGIARRVSNTSLW